MQNIFPRTRSQRLRESTGPTNAISKHRKKMTVYGTMRNGDVTRQRQLYSVDLIVTKEPPWVKRRRNRAANRVARKARRVNRLRAS